jgi:1,4-dihydroxy-2-naphthoate octaprenyltransferase
MSPAWPGFLKLVLTLVLGAGLVGLIGYLEAGWTLAVIGAVVGALATLYGIRKVVIDSRHNSH